MKNAKHFLLTVAMLLCSFAVSAQYFEIERVRYNVISDSEVGVTSNYGTEYNGAIVIPYSVTYNSKNYSVTSIKSIAFSDCTEKQVEKIYFKGKEVVYAGWQHGMTFEFKDLDGNTVWCESFPHWDH